MNSKVTLIRTDDPASGKVIPAPASALQKLADSLAACMSALTTALREQRDAEAILAELAPAGFDHAASGRTVAEARVHDLLSGGSTADDVQQRLDRERAATETAAAAFAKRQANARVQADRAGPMIEALRAQALELDRAVRRELAKLGIQMEAPAVQALVDAAEAYTIALIEYRATIWLQQAEEVGERGRQFISLPEADLSLGFPSELNGSLPAGWAPSSVTNRADFDRYEFAQVVGDRRRALMELVTDGVYPKAGALLQRADQDGGDA